MMEFLYSVACVFGYCFLLGLGSVVGPPVLFALAGALFEFISERFFDNV